MGGPRFFVPCIGFPWSLSPGSLSPGSSWIGSCLYLIHEQRGTGGPHLLFSGETWLHSLRQFSSTTLEFTLEGDFYSPHSDGCFTHPTSPWMDGLPRVVWIQRSAMPQTQKKGSIFLPQADHGILRPWCSWAFTILSWDGFSSCKTTLGLDGRPHPPNVFPVQIFLPNLSPLRFGAPMLSRPGSTSFHTPQPLLWLAQQCRRKVLT